ncbi:Soluble NSF Attachment Protein (SNAP) Receptor (SNARE) [Ectocarpus siliculosus]|uniref:Soluble NSF Attachment Protein (SNAP) Receptor (SNARE) n=1 Tax=Ectocarpus siliculosus TaxID=2880 RepID=D8LHK7_ECTSI|nr:Soluble NSF Attachment Protein (SNAP) Receptor (SNARE) [Ectocarpus siliculosus]|eukprot:CBN79289.1 Soluble NSF Attachment Protein (SNAP) Receptor (SNARE) [Ectocarpus siliculosus]
MEPFGFESGPSRAVQTFQSHEESYHRCSMSINRAINGIQLNNLVDAVGATSLPLDLQEAEQHVKGMEIEVRSMKGNERRQCQSRANQCRADLKALRRSIDQAGQRAQAEELMRRSGGGAIGGGPRNFSESGGDLGGLGPDLAQQSLARSRLSLQDSRRVLEETEGIGRGVMGDLESQRESLLRSRTSVRDTGAAAGQARRLLGSISRRELRHRLCLYAVIALLSAAIVFVLYLKIRRRSLL